MTRTQDASTGSKKPSPEEIERLAKFMGWRKKEIENQLWWVKPILGTDVCQAPHHTAQGYIDHFNPYEDWNHTHQVLDKVMEDEELFGKFKRNFMVTTSYRSYELHDNIYLYMKASKEELMDTLISLLDS